MALPPDDQNSGLPEPGLDSHAPVLLPHNGGHLQTGAAPSERSGLPTAVIHFRRPYPKGRQAHGAPKKVKAGTCRIRPESPLLPGTFHLTS